MIKSSTDVPDSSAPTQPSHNRYRIDVMMDQDLIHSMAVPADRSKIRVLRLACDELGRVAVATHAVVRGLSGSKVYIKQGDSRISTLLKYRAL